MLTLSQFLFELDKICIEDCHIVLLSRLAIISVVKGILC